MSEDTPVVWRTFDPDAELAISERHLPHWDQVGALTFVTFRTADSMPRSVLAQWEAEQLDWLARNRVHGVGLDAAFRKGVLSEPLRRALLKYRKGRWLDHLDTCHGRCALRDPECAEIVSKSLHNFDGERYDLERFVVMPNHAHVLVQMRTGFELRRQCTAWLRYTGRRINQRIRSHGAFWQSEPFDHVVRNEKQFAYLQRYIEDNPKKAGLKPGEYLFWKRSGS